MSFSNVAFKVLAFFEISESFCHGYRDRDECESERGNGGCGGGGGGVPRYS